MRKALARFTYYLSIWMAVAAASFTLFHLIPSDPVRAMLGPNASESQVATVRQELGLDKPVMVQFSRYMSRISKFDFGQSFVDRRSVGDELGKRFKVTLSLATVTVVIIFSYLILSTTLRLAGIKAWIAELGDFLCVSLPVLFVGIAIALISIRFYPFTRFSGELASFSDWMFLFLAAFVLSLYPMGILGRILRKQLSEIIGARYVLSARAFGLSNSLIWSRYVLRNASVPVLATFGNQLPLLISSTFIVELIFSIPGIGALLLRSVLERDLPMLEGIVLSTSVLILLISYTLELIYPYADPRIRGASAI